MALASAVSVAVKVEVSSKISSCAFLSGTEWDARDGCLHHLESWEVLPQPG